MNRQRYVQLPLLLTALLLCISSFAQPVNAANETFHIRGTIVDPSEAVIPGAKVVFQNDKLDKTLTANEHGVYEGDLPVGSYTMTVLFKGFEPYRRPLFRVASAEIITFDATLRIRRSCDPIVVSSDAIENPCSREHLFSIPSNDGVLFQLWIRYTKHNVSDHTYSYTGDDAPVFVAYNLFSLRAGNVVYDSSSRTITASGNVVAVDKSNVTKTAESLSFKIENGQATRIR